LNFQKPENFPSIEFNTLKISINQKPAYTTVLHTIFIQKGEHMLYIENEGALFRTLGGMQENPSEIYYFGEGWVKYEGDVPKTQGWGEIISEKEANQMIARIDAKEEKK
jgi:hypothetical protein